MVGCVYYLFTISGSFPAEVEGEIVESFIGKACSGLRYLWQYVMHCMEIMRQ